MISVIDFGAPGADAAREIAAACRDSGFFYVVGHGVDPQLSRRLEELHREFFALPEAHKQQIAMQRGGRAWRGYFPVGAELTSGEPDQKQGIYYGSERPPGDPRPLYGPNLFPEDVPELRITVLEYLDQMTQFAHALMRTIALSLELPADYFFDRYTRDPLILFRAFHYPPLQDETLWSVGEHTDYGLLTILRQDDVGGLEVKSGGSGRPLLRFRMRSSAISATCSTA